MSGVACHVHVMVCSDGTGLETVMVWRGVLPAAPVPGDEIEFGENTDLEVARRAFGRRDTEDMLVIVKCKRFIAGDHPLIVRELKAAGFTIVSNWDGDRLIDGDL